MTGSDKTVKVRLDVETGPYAKGMSAASSATRKLGSDIDSVGTKSKGFASKTGEATNALKGMAIAGAAVAATALVSFLSDSVAAASDLNETVAKTGQIFGQEALPGLEKFAEGAAEAMGQSKQQALDAAATFGVFGKSAGLAGEPLADFSRQMVTLSSDMASFSNTSPEEAIEAIGSALRGEAEPIRKYGVLLDDATLRQRALKLGLIATTKDALTPQQKVLAAQAEILAQTSDAQGDFARTSDGLANQQRILAAELENSKVALGEALLPAMNKAVEAMRKGLDAAVAIAGAFDKIPGPVKVAVGALIAFHLLRGPIGGFLTSTIGQLKTLTTTLKSGGIAGGAKAAGSALMGAFGGPLGIAVGLGAAALTFWAQEAAKTDAIAQGLKDTIDKTTGAFTEQSKATVKEALLGDLSTEDIKRMQELGVNFDTLADAALKGGPDLQKAREQLDGLKNFDWLFLKDDADVIDGLSAGLGRAADGAERSKVIFGELKPPADDAAKAVGGVADAGFKAAEGVSAQAQAAADAADAIDVLTVSQKANETAADILRATSHDLAAALLSVKAAAGDADAAEIAYQDSLDTANDRMKKRIELEKELRNAGGKSDRTKNLEADLSRATDADKRAKIQIQLDRSRAKDAKGTTAEQARIREELEKYTLTLDINTEAGRNNKKALLDLKDAALQRAEANLKDGDSVDKVKQSMQTAREEFIKTARGFGATKKEAEVLATQYGLTKGSVDELNRSMGKTPKKVVSDVKVNTAAANTAIAGVNALLTALENRRIVVPVTASVAGVADSINSVGRLFGWKPPVKKATGGFISGAGTATSDSIPALLSNGEYVLKAAAVSKYGKRQLDDMNAMRFAQGGFVSRMPGQRAAGAGLDLDGLAALMGDRLTINMQTNDPAVAARHAIDELEWRAVNG